MAFFFFFLLFFQASAPVSSSQLSAFRGLAANTPGVADNFRPTLPLNGRTVLDAYSGCVGNGASATVGATVGAARVNLFGVLAVALAAFFK